MFRSSGSDDRSLLCPGGFIIHRWQFLKQFSQRFPGSSVQGYCHKSIGLLSHLCLSSQCQGRPAISQHVLYEGASSCKLDAPLQTESRIVFYIDLFSAGREETYFTVINKAKNKNELPSHVKGCLTEGRVCLGDCGVSLRRGWRGELWNVPPN